MSFFSHEFGLYAGAATAPSSSVTWLSYIALPLVGASFLAAIWMLRRLEGDRAGEEAALSGKWKLDRDWPAFWLWFIWFGLVFLCILVPPFAGITIPHDLLLLAAVPSTFFLISCLRRMSGAGTAHRENTSILCFFFLASHGYLGFMLIDMLLLPDRGVLHPRWIVLVLVSGAIACLLPSLKSAVDPRRARAARIFLFVTAVILATLIVDAFGTAGAPPEDLSAWVEKENPGLERPIDWEDLADAVEFLDAQGEERPPLDRLSETYHQGMTAWIESDGKKNRVNFAILAAAYRIGFVNDEEQAFLCGRTTSRRLLKHEGPLDLPEVYLPYVTALAQSETLTLEQHDHLVARLLEAWQQIGAESRIDNILALCRIAEQLGAMEAISFSTDDLHARLVRMWVAPPAPGERRGWLQRRDTGGFGDGSEVPELNATEWNTALAMKLIHCFGPPEKIDLGLVRSYLEERAVSSLWDGGIKRRKVKTILAYEKLEASGLLPPDPSSMEILRGERLLLGALLLVIIAIYATRRSPRLE